MAHLAHHIAGETVDMLSVKLVKCDFILYLSSAVQIFFNARQISNKVMLVYLVATYMVTFIWKTKE